MIRVHLAILLVLFSSLTAFSQDTAAPRHPLTDLPPGGEIKVNHFFPLHATKQFPAGGEIKVVVGVHNAATESYNMSAIMGSINSPSDLKLYIQNFTQQVYFEVVEAGEELSLEYTFRPDPALPARDYHVMLTLFYEDAKHGFYSTTFFNGTVDIAETPKLIDTEILFLYLLIVGVLGVAGLYAYNTLSGLGFFKTTKTKKVTRKQETVKVEDEDEWLTGTNYDPKKKKAAAATAKKSS